MLTALLGVVFLSVPFVHVEPRSAPTEPTGSFAPAPNQDDRIARETLPNGFELLSLADGSVGERVFGTLFVRCGRLDELEGQEGAADLLAATWIAGGSAETSGESLQAWLEERGASLEVSAETDHLSIDFHCAPGDLRALYGKLVELLATPRYPEVPFEAARQALAEATDGDEDEREPFRVLERFALTSSTRAGRLATRASVLALDREEVMFFHKVFLVADRMLLGLCGAVNADVLDVTREFAERVPAVETRARDWSTYLEAPKRTTVFLAPGDDAHLWVVAPVPGPGETDHALLHWALAGQVGAAADGATVERRRAAGLARTELPRVLVSTEWLHASLRVDSGFAPARAKEALAELARVFAPEEFAALHERAKLAAILEARAPRDVTTPRGSIERALLDSIRHSERAKPAVEPTPDDLAAAARRWIDPARLWVLATGPVERLRKELEADYDVRLLDATWSVASTLDGTAKLEQLFAALG
ncbi:MAG: insulinase family protein, partial [Planctomycetes bacterium]|nr:insulinase family protein [Planctomycetota bacterium]